MAIIARGREAKGAADCHGVKVHTMERIQDDKILTTEEEAAFDATAAAEVWEQLKTLPEATPIDAAEWLAEPDEPARPIIDGLIETGEVVAVVGSAKAGKSFVAMQLAMSIAAGRPFLGHPSHRRRVLVANLEVAQRQYKHRLRRMISALNIRADELAGQLFLDNLKAEEISWAGIQAEAASVAAEVIVIDPFYQIFKGSEVDDEAVQTAIDEIKRLQRAEYTIIIVFHAPKGFNGDRSLIDMISGSSRLARYPEAIFGIMNHADGDDLRVFQSIMRNNPPEDDMTLRLMDGAFIVEPMILPTVETAASRKRRAESEAREMGKETAARNSMSDLRTELARVLDVHGDDLPTVTQLHEELEQRFPRARVRQFVSARIDGGELVRTPERRVIDGKVAILRPRGGGRVLISTPDRVARYVDSFNRFM